jgi:twitching motility protein PilT
MRILVVDDEPAVLRLEMRALEAVGHQCRGASTLLDARGFLTNELFDLAVLDVHLGNDSGLEFAKVIRKDFPETSVIMVTGAADFTSVSDARLAGALDYLVKPVSPTELAEAAQRISEIRARRGKGTARRRGDTARQKTMPAAIVPPAHVKTAPAAIVAPPRQKAASVAIVPPRQKTAPIAIVPAGEAEPAIDSLFRAMVAQGASDLHLSAGVRPNIRVDGEMRALDPHAAPLSAEDVVELLSPIIPGKNRVEFEKRRDSDFAYEVPGLARFRGNVFLDRKGMGAVFRRVPTKITTAEELELAPSILQLCALKKGLVLVTGPTGSGKSTTLAAMVDYINRTRADHIITIEDPIEFVHENKRCVINQREVHSHTRSFKAALRAALREDPDIVLIGEMRDLETVAIALETAETGHLVFGTLHTTTAASTIDRIIDQFPSGSQSQIRVMLSESLAGVIAQTLCRRTNGGRVAALEVLIANVAIANLIREGKTFQIPTMMQVGKSAGMVTLDDALGDLVRRGIISQSEASRHRPEKTGTVP